ncbi:MAG: fructose-6-phosphate aldolase [Deinococcota bacterium]|jgi:transaldolase|nr:fructose-6-phosphate aldolase [Deinococcota bacterium]
MDLYLDTADISEIRELAAWGVLGGVTTNPSLIARAGRNIEEVIAEISELVPGPVSAEVVSVDAQEMIKEGRELARIADNVVVKVPLIPAGLTACRALAGDGVKVNVTLCFSTNQAILAAHAGAWCVSPFVGRLDDINQDGMELIGEIADVFGIHDYETKILAASIRHGGHVTRAALAGADIATMPAKVLKSMVKHPLTDAGLESFLKDHDKVKEEAKEQMERVG